MRRQDGIDYLSTLEAADRLGFTTARISQLVRAGLLVGVVRGEHRSLWVPALAVAEYQRTHPSKRRMIPIKRADHKPATGGA